ncbi:hypothetical protein IF2G_07486 [Cordyceps javanica]|nr:hypothetical protein IF2G_07486 [Cordyceps javanica]
MLCLPPALFVLRATPFYSQTLYPTLCIIRCAFFALASIPHLRLQFLGLASDLAHTHANARRSVHCLSTAQPRPTIRRVDGTRNGDCFVSIMLLPIYNHMYRAHDRQWRV